MDEWTRDMVEKRVLEAAEVLRRMPTPRVRGYFSTWPELVRTFGDLVGQEPVQRRPLPSPSAMSRMEETITWNRFLERVDANFMWLCGCAPRARRGRRCATVTASASPPRTGAGTTR